MQRPTERPLKVAAEQQGLRWRAVTERMKKLGYVKRRSDGEGLVPDYATMARASHFKTRNRKYWVPGPNGRIPKERTEVWLTDAGVELMVRLCSDLKKPTEERNAS